MQKYVGDLTTNDVIMIDGNAVVLDYLESHDDDRITVRGYFESDGTDFSVTVPSDFSFRVAL